MIILIAPENDIPNEIEMLHQLFQEGLTCYHLRKPGKKFSQLLSYLNDIDSAYHNRIVVHHCHELINDFNLKGIHFKEQIRKNHGDHLDAYLKKLNLLQKTISASFHDLEDLKTCPFQFDYHLLSPVFSSISKEGYKGRRFDVKTIDKTIIGLGGIVPETIAPTLKLGYKGIAVLGGVWNTENPVESFKSIKRSYQAFTTK
ncbi:thiamine phosphate synthase [Winogradskyella rapida]|uniref:Thiamine phosphate synthase n=1 Tax=Winogradskyella rapida TaxID=549701 RepID=A0ABW3KVJ0_9FLAO